MVGGRDTAPAKKKRPKRGQLKNIDNSVLQTENSYWVKVVNRSPRDLGISVLYG